MNEQKEWRPLPEAITIKESKIEKYQALIRQEMENALDPLLSLEVPLLVESSFGDNWDEAH